VTNTEILFLIAVILFAVAAVLRLMARSIDGALVAVGLGCVALGWLIL
jgi:hypothetical protein